MIELISTHPYIAGWLAFVLLVYLYAGMDYVYYRYELKRRAIKVYEAITEEK